MRGVNGVPTEAVSSGRTSIHPVTQGLYLHPDGQGWKTNRGDMVTTGKAMYGRWEPHRQAICHDEEATCSSSRTQHILLHPLQAWLRSTAVPCQLTDPTPASLTRILPLTPFFLYPFTSSLGELNQRLNSLEGNGWEMCLNWDWNVIYDFPEVQQIYWLALNLLLCSGNVESCEVSLSLFNLRSDSGDEPLLHLPVSTVGVIW